MPNDNPYSGQPTYSRDVCSLMRRINALEALVSLVPGQSFSALDFDLSDGRVYVMAYVGRVDGYRGTRILVHDASTGAPVQDFAVPTEVGGGDTPVFSLIDIQRREQVWSRPRMCVGGGSIFISANRGQYAGAVGVHDADIQLGRGCLFKFSTNGDGVTHNDDPWPQLAEPLQGRPYLPAHCFGGQSGDLERVKSGDDFPVMRRDDSPDVMQMHYIDGYIWGMVKSSWVFGGSGIQGNGGMAGRSGHLCFASEDLVDLGWVPFSEGDPWALSFQNPDLYVGIGSPLSRGALAVNGGNLYFDATDNLSGTTPDYFYWSPGFFGKIEIDRHASGEADFMHIGFGVESLYLGHPSNIDAVTPHALYATDGTYLFGWYDVFDKRIGTTNQSIHGTRLGLRRYLLSTGALVDTWWTDEGIGEVLQIRVYDGVLWLLYIAGADEGHRAVIESRDTTTMAVILRFYVGTARAQTEFHAYTDTGRVSLGEPDGGVAVPDDEALYSNDAIKAPNHIADMRAALTGVAGFFLAPSGNPLHLRGSDDAENLYRLAMGDRTKYGATGGERLTWTRAATQIMLETSVVYVDEDSTNVYQCKLDHVSTAANRPLSGGFWTDYWQAVNPDDVGGAIGGWILDAFYTVHKTYDIDIGEVAECVALLEGSPLATGL